MQVAYNNNNNVYLAKCFTKYAHNNYAYLKGIFIFLYKKKMPCSIKLHASAEHLKNNISQWEIIARAIQNHIFEIILNKSY